MKKNPIFLILILVLILIQVTSCKNYYLSKYCNKITSKDSIVHDTIIKDKIVVLKKDSIIEKKIILPSNTEINLKNPCDSLGRLKDGNLYYLTSQFYTLKLKVKNGELILEQKNDSIISLISTIKEKSDSIQYLKESFFFKYESNSTIDNTKYLTTWQKIKVSKMFDIIGIVIFILLIIYKTIKIFK